MNLGLSGKRALVTCASSGIGLACARRFASEGVEVIALNRQGILRNPVQGAECSGRIVPVACDLANSAMLRKVTCENDGVDVVIFLPLRERQASLLDINATEYRDAFDRSFFPLLELVQTYLPGMVRRRFGRVVSLLGSSTFAPLWDHSLANVSRLAIAGLGSGATREFVQHGVTFNNIVLGVFDTPGLKALWKKRAEEGGISFEAYEDAWRAVIPGRTLGDPEQCAAMAALLASPLMSYVTGQSIRMDGGLHLTL
ncbi:MAG: hypothetical protein CBARDMAM_5137 [uncultured Caballeronia sp.]|nr:MAG: hypothetical protein CBARDMAM_5137 [uncultured Caballeronia sp.]